MGNRSSSGDKPRRQSEEAKTNEDTAFKSQRDFTKSQSMSELTRASKKKKKNSVPTIPKNVAGSVRNGSSSISRQKSIRRDISHPITANHREIILQCLENPHSEFGNKTCQRIFEKRVDFQNYVFALGKERAFQMTVRLKELVEQVISNVDDVDQIASLCRAYGEEHVELKQFGFKPDFWVALADAITVEGVILDMANHQPADTVAAWSHLVAMMFSNVRDGYYDALRQHRMNTRKGIRRQKTIDSASSMDTLNSPPGTLPHGSRLPLHPSAIRSVSMYSVEAQPANGVMHIHKPMPIFE